VDKDSRAAMVAGRTLGEDDEVAIAESVPRGTQYGRTRRRRLRWPRTRVASGDFGREGNPTRHEKGERSGDSDPEVTKTQRTEDFRWKKRGRCFTRWIAMDLHHPKPRRGPLLWIFSSLQEAAAS
jgi:hypothetical protein